MSEAYEELIGGETIQRRRPPAGHELLVERLHRLVAQALPLNSTLRRLPPRTIIEMAGTCQLRPDLAVVRTEHGGVDGPGVQLYLVAEVLLAGDHHVDTVIKKQVWADVRLPRLWMVDPRYLNVEVYGCGEFGFGLSDILAHQQVLTDPHLPGLGCPMHELFADL